MDMILSIYPNFFSSNFLVDFVIIGIDDGTL